MDDFRVSVKSFIVNNDKILILKRREDDPNKPGIWELPGGRLSLGEDPFLGLQRETKEETGLEVDILNPLNIRHAIRDDGQTVTMLIFLCQAVHFLSQFSCQLPGLNIFPARRDSGFITFQP